METDVADEYAGRSGRCARCGKMITVPSSLAAPGGAAAAKSSQGPVVLVIVLVVLSIVLR